MGLGQVHLWTADLDVGPFRLQALLGTLSLEERARALRFRFERDRRRFVAARGLLRSTLASYLGSSPEELRFRYGPYGKPYLSLTSSYPDIRFNLSRSEGLALYAVALGREVGVDLERLRPWSFARGVAARFFSTREKEALAAAPEPERAELFFACWTAREAHLKARGLGLAGGLGGPALQLEPGETDPLNASWTGPPDERPLEVKTLRPAPGYVAALAAAGGGWELLTLEHESSLTG